MSRAGSRFGSPGGRACAVGAIWCCFGVFSSSIQADIRSAYAVVSGQKNRAELNRIQPYIREVCQ